MSGKHIALHTDEAADEITIESVQDAEPLLNRQARLRNERFSAHAGEYEELCTIPVVLLEKFKNEHGLDFFNPDDAKKIEQLILSDPQYAKFRAFDGRRDRHVIVKGAR